MTLYCSLEYWVIKLKESLKRRVSRGLSRNGAPRALCRPWVSPPTSPLCSFVRWGWTRLSFKYMMPRGKTVEAGGKTAWKEKGTSVKKWYEKIYKEKGRVMKMKREQNGGTRLPIIWKHKIRKSSKSIQPSLCKEGDYTMSDQRH